MAETISKKAPTRAPDASTKPAAKMGAAKKPPVATKPTIAAVAKPVARTPSKVMKVSDEQRYRMVAEAAYYRAESNQFKSDPVRDWIEAESDIAALLSGNN